MEWIDPILLQENEKDDDDDEIGGSLCYYFDANDKNRPIEMYKPIDKERLQLMRNEVVSKYGNGMIDKGLPQLFVQSNKRLGDFASAYKYNQDCIAMTTNDRVNPVSKYIQIGYKVLDRFYR